MYGVVMWVVAPPDLALRSSLGNAVARSSSATTDTPRNAASRDIHCLLGHEGMAPRDFLATGKSDLQRYTTVTTSNHHVITVVPSGHRFSVTCADGSILLARKILLATGLEDELPDLRVSINSMVGAFTIARIAMDSSIGISLLPFTARATRPPISRS